MPAPPDSAVVRGRLVEALEADLIGPFAGSAHHATAEEVLELPPSRWYVTGFLIPEDAPEVEDAEADDELGAGDDEDDEAPEAHAEEAPRVRPQLPRSLGLSVLLPRGDDGVITATVEWAVRPTLRAASADQLDQFLHGKITKLLLDLDPGQERIVKLGGPGRSP